MHQQPDLPPAWFSENRRWADEVGERFLEGLRKAGLRKE
jgi:hypothetical protein